jgi:hypothetical protein
VQTAEDIHLEAAEDIHPAEAAEAAVVEERGYP